MGSLYETAFQRVQMDRPGHPDGWHRHTLLFQHDFRRPRPGHHGEICYQRGSACRYLDHRLPSRRVFERRRRPCAGQKGSKAVHRRRIDPHCCVHGLAHICAHVYRANACNRAYRRVPAADNHRGTQDGRRAFPPGRDAPCYGLLRRGRRTGHHPRVRHGQRLSEP